MAELAQIKTFEDFKAVIEKSSARPALVHFSAAWCEPCVQIDQVVAQLAVSFPAIGPYKVEAEELDEAAEQCEIESVPTCILFHAGREQFRVVGANPMELSKAVQQFVTAHPSLTPNASSHPKTPAPGGLDPKLRARLQSLVNSSPAVLFMKGSPDEPKCGFSRTIVGLLRENKVAFKHVDILEDDEVRQGLKKLMDWPTYPQLYFDGELVGGLDIVKEQIADGSFLSEVPELARQDKLDERLQSLTRRAPVMLFMKGSPAEPRCGFSRQIVEILQQNGVSFDSFDILTDDAVRQGLKKLSKWPTYPQLYVEGELLGGLDLVREMVEEGEFIEAIPEASRTSQ